MSNSVVCSPNSTFTYRKGNVVTDIEMGYHGIFDGEPDKRGWDKCSLEYAMKNEGRLKNHIRRMISKYSNCVIEDSNDIYQDLVCDLYGADDFKIIDGVRMTTSVGNYVYKRLGFLIDTYREATCKDKTRRKDNVIRDEDGELVDIFDSIPSGTDEYDGVLYENVDSFLEPLEIKRNLYGFDIFMAMYVSMICTNNGIGREKCIKIVSLLANKDVCDIKEGYEKLLEDEEATSAVQAIAKSKTLSGLEEYVYGKEQIRNIIRKCLAML